MDTDTTAKPTRIIAYMGEDEHSARVAEVAITKAKETAAQLILYDADAASRLGPPLPTWWSAEGSGDAFPDRLNPDELEAAGRGQHAELVRDARAKGVDAYGWLPSARGAKGLANYAAKVGADLLILPADLEDIGLFARIKGENTPGEIEQQAQIPVLTVELAPVGSSKA